MGIVRNGVPEELVRLLRRNFKIKHFIETGTCHGDTASWASSEFAQVTTIEGAQKYFDEASEKYGYLTNIRFIHADSREACAKLVPELKEPALFWLDGHWCGEGTFGKEDQCPLLDEIRLINTSTVTHFILIDDARLFLSPPCEPHPIEQWPDIDQVLTALKSSVHDYSMIVFDDVIIAIPQYAKEAVVQYCRNISTQEVQQLIQKQKSAFSQGAQSVKNGFKLMSAGLKEKLKRQH